MEQIFQRDLPLFARTVRPRTTKFGSITHERGPISGVNLTPPQGGGAPALPKFGGSFLFMQTQNYQIWRGDTYGEGLVLRGSHAPVQMGRSPRGPQLLGFSIYAYTI